MITFKHFLTELKLTIKYHTKLNPKIWHNGKLSSKDRDELIKNAYDFVDFNKQNKDNIKDIVFTGSSANFNYTKYSDIDVHILCKTLDDDHDTLMKKKNEWTKAHSMLKLHDYPVEFYIQKAQDAFPTGQGVYSLLSDKWLIEPVHLSHIKVLKDPKTITKIEYEISRIKDIIKSKDIDEVKQYKERLRKLRASGLHRSGPAGGEFSIENILFKELRNRGLVDKMRQHYQDLTDKNNQQ